MEKYLIVIVNYVNWKYTIECVESLLKANVPRNNILIIDNASPNDSFYQLSKLYSEIQMIQNSENLGFPTANNIGIKLALQGNYDYVIFLNNDTIVDKNAISKLLNEMEKHSKVSIGTGRIFFYPSINKLWYDGGKLVNWRGLAIHNNYDKEISNIVDRNEARSVNFISGCFMCIRLSHIKILGYWDERFFLYLEDIEYCARARKNNLEMIYVPDSIIYHKVGERPNYTGKLIYYSVRNRLLLIKLAFSPIAKFYFISVIFLKSVYWFIFNWNNFTYLKQALVDYKNNYYYEFVEDKSKKNRF